MTIETTSINLIFRKVCKVKALIAKSSAKSALCEKNCIFAEKRIVFCGEFTFKNNFKK